MKREGINHLYFSWDLYHLYISGFYLVLQLFELPVEEGFKSAV